MKNNSKSKYSAWARSGLIIEPKEIWEFVSSEKKGIIVSCEMDSERKKDHTAWENIYNLGLRGRKKRHVFKVKLQNLEVIKKWTSRITY